MKKLFCAALTALAFSHVAYAQQTQSTINPLVPSQNGPLTSSLLRNNFLAAYNDINYILGRATPLVAANNLSDLTNAGTARTNLGLGALAILNTLPVPGASTLGGVKSVTCSTAQFVNSVDTSGNPTCATPTTGSSTAAAGSSGQFQTNSSGSLAGVTVSGAVSINGTTGVSTLAAGQAVANLGYTPANKAGDTFTGDVTLSAAIPRQYWTNTGNATDTKTWREVTDASGTHFFQAANDALSAFSNVLFFTRSGATATGATFGVPVNFGAAQTNVGQSISISDPGPANWATFTGVRDPLRVAINGFTTASEWGANQAIPNVNAIVGGIRCPANYNPMNGSYCGGVAGYGYNFRPTPDGAAYQTATGVAGFGGTGVNSSSAWGLVGFVGNCAENCGGNSGFEGVSGKFQLISGVELDMTTYKTAAGADPKFTRATAMLVQGTADSQARFDRATGSTVFGITISNLDANSYVNKDCAVSVYSNCWDAGISFSDGSSAVALQIGATALNVPTAAAASQSIAFFSYNSSGVAQVATDFLSATGSRTVQYPAGGSFTFSENGTLRGSLVGTKFRIEGTLGSGVYTVAALPTCNAGLEGARAYVTDATVGSVPYTSAVVGGSNNRIPVYCNSVAWTSG